MVMPNAERVGRGLDAVRDGIRPGCEAAWQAHHGDGWAEIVHNRDAGAAGEPAPNDLSWLLKGIHNTWNELWKHRFGPTERAYSSELRDYRNKWAHQEAFSTDDTYRMLDTAERLLQAFGAAEQTKIVQGLRRELQRQMFDEQSRGERRKTAARPTESEPLQGLAAWRDVITPHADVASGRFEQAEFAADLFQVSRGEAEEEYQDPVAFFGRTYLTNGLRQLLLGAARRLSGDGGDPIIDLQTNFGGGKTHSMIALYHLASGVSAVTLPGVGELLAEEGVRIPSSVARAVVVGQWVSAASPTQKPDGTEVHTLWGEIAWQLAGAEGYALVAAEDRAGTNPGDKLIDLFRLAGPAIVLIDEWVAYARQLPSRDGEPKLIGGDFSTQFTFAQALSEAARAVSNVVLLISIPASDIEVGGEKGAEALVRLRNVVHRVSVPWRPAEDDESFEIVRRRLFEPISTEKARERDGVIRAFCDAYRAKPGDFPSEVQEGEYRRRMELSYPIHPELFDRLYKDWSTLDRFQRTRGVLRLMATVISVLWQRGDQNLLIMPGTLPIDEPLVSSELTKYLEDGWDPVIRTDVDGPNALPLRIDQEQRNLGRYSATRRVARSVFLSSAPREDARGGIDVKHIVLGTAQPGESSGTFADALRRLSNDATYLYVDGAQYWYSLRPNITRKAADRAASDYTDDHADDELKRRLQSIRALGPFAAVHGFPDGPGDIVDDDDGAHLVILPTTAAHVGNQEASGAITMAEAILAQRNAGPRINRNLLVFCAANEALLTALRQAARSHLAWKSIFDEREQLQLTPNDIRQATTKVKETSETIEQRIFETYQHVLVPDQTPGVREIRWHQTRTSGAGSLPERVARKLESEERLITTYGGTRVRMDLDRIPLWTDRHDVSVEALWAAYAQFPYLPRLASPAVLRAAVSDGVSKMDWERESFAYADAHDGARWVGLVVGQHVEPRAGGLVVQPNDAASQLAREKDDGNTEPGAGAGAGPGPDPAPLPRPGSTEPTKFYGRFALDSVRAIRQLEEILNNVAHHLANAPDGEVAVTLELNATSTGYDDRVQRVVRENATQLGSESHEFEK